MVHPAAITGTSLPVQPGVLRGNNQISVSWWGRSGQLQRHSNLVAGGLKTCYANLAGAERGAAVAGEPELQLMHPPVHGRVQHSEA